VLSQWSVYCIQLSVQTPCVVAFNDNTSLITQLRRTLSADRWRLTARQSFRRRSSSFCASSSSPRTTSSRARERESCAAPTARASPTQSPVRYVSARGWSMVSASPTYGAHHLALEHFTFELQRCYTASYRRCLLGIPRPPRPRFRPASQPGRQFGFRDHACANKTVTVPSKQMAAPPCKQ
jgi:hypothetical protein